MTTDEHGRRMAVQADDDAGFSALTRELRRLRTVVAGSRIDGDAWDDVALVRELADRLEARATPIDPRRYPAWGMGEHIQSNPAMGARSTVAPPLEPVGSPDGTVTAELVLGKDYEGPPGCVHGGIIALLFDEMLGMANSLAEVVAMTAELTLTYVSPTPIGETVRFVTRNTGIEGRKTWAEGELYAGDRLCARAHGLFVVPSWLDEVAAE